MMPSNVRMSKTRGWIAEQHYENAKSSGSLGLGGGIRTSSEVKESDRGNNKLL